MGGDSRFECGEQLGRILAFAGVLAVAVRGLLIFSRAAYLWEAAPGAWPSGSASVAERLELVNRKLYVDTGRGTAKPDLSL